jgi:hypothetical protein
MYSPALKARKEELMELEKLPPSFKVYKDAMNIKRKLKIAKNMIPPSSPRIEELGALWVECDSLIEKVKRVPCVERDILDELSGYDIRMRDILDELSECDTKERERDER